MGLFNLGPTPTYGSSAQTDKPYSYRQALGNITSFVGDKLGIPETGISERIAGGPTLNYNKAYVAESTQNQPSGGGGGGSWGPTQPSAPADSELQQLQKIKDSTGLDPTQLTKYNELSQQADPYAGLRNEITSGWDNYIGSLNDMLNNGLTGQRTAQEGIANEQFNMGKNTLDLQNTQGQQQFTKQRGEVEDNQAKTLRDISENLRNSFMAGNVYLGARGAGDSSAADQYSYALTKVGSKQRGDVMSQAAKQLGEIQDRETNLKNIYDTETRNLESEKNIKISQVAEWFANAQNQIKQQIATGQLNKSQDLAGLTKDLLNRGMQIMDQINQDARDRKSALESWAMSNSQNINQLKANMQQIQQFAPQLSQAQPISGTPMVDSSGNFRVSTGYGYGYGSDDEQRKSLFGGY